MATAVAAEPSPSFVGSASCGTCHSAEYSSWKSSHHAEAWRPASTESVAGDFDEAVFEHAGRTTRFFHRDERFFIETEDFTDGPKVLEVKGVGGIEPLQQYLVETEPGKLQSFDVVWDQEKKSWFHLYPDQVLPPDDGFHWSGPYKSWNARCAECHATDFRKNYDARTRQYSSTQAESGVGCEACHGPGEAHVAWAENEESVLRSSFPGTDGHGLLLSFRETIAETEIQQCAGCHSRREPLEDGSPMPGTPFHDSYRLALLRDGLYHPDGQILDEVYVYGSFLQSKMYAKGLRCSDCHDPHSARLKADGNAVCTQCHSSAGNPAFASLPKKSYDDPTHHFHEPDSAGAACVSCHMIERTYMGVDGRRDHSFRVPRPDLSVKIGTPNACTDCHTDKTAGWAAEVLENRYPDSRHRGPHFAEVFANARADASGVGEDLLDIALHESFPGIVRASALNLLGNRSGPEQRALAAGLLRDPDPLVRAAAVPFAGLDTDGNGIALLTDALEDPVKSVRIAAARQMLRVPLDNTPERTRLSARSAQREWQETLSAKLDFPETHMAIGGTALVLRNSRAAIRAFQEATSLDPQLAEAWIMQVRLHMAEGDLAAAEVALQRALQNVPDNAALLDLKRQFTSR
ncbi:multiheme c-type cytochrome [uncultured Roseibium sp.]|uniref:multiheme c-type cytochrome n=1 Tax=uncultured Roseibium sp. TaxID=1936171 RepID=UPI0026098313|nr:multiheme c-type cytochrome [uncultured Roseibium sp.]